ncbi:NAD(P)-dependent oxidoreductase [Acidimangrovimonas sediminis]|uniref:NAD(P)-dependent oxidoreductase n=1 Tax=Acidimangrovimonas sediminis TaxID=2056283 RepID=UPI000C7FE6C3|nr:NAD(P)-dependent oxidoreductase [Acidimangrovimonas sediminis]
MTRPLIVRTDRELEVPGLDAALRERGDLVLLPDGITEAALAEAVAGADLLLMCYTPVTARVIAAAPRLRGIVKYGVGIDAIDIPAAIARGIPVVNIPEYAEATVAEGAITLALSLLKRLPEVAGGMQRDGWLWPETRLLGRDLAGACVGVVGCGRIGRHFAGIAAAGFGARVLGYDPQVDAATLANHGIEKTDSLHDLLSAADVVSLHATLGPGSRALIGREELACLGPGAILVNTARGALIDEAALVETVLAGRIGGVALDVYGQEPLAHAGHPLSPLFGRDEVILFPHLTFFTHEAQARLEADTLARCEEILGGLPVTVRSHDPRLRAQGKGVVFPPG